MQLPARGPWPQLLGDMPDALSLTSQSQLPSPNSYQLCQRPLSPVRLAVSLLSQHVQLSALHAYSRNLSSLPNAVQRQSQKDSIPFFFEKQKDSVLKSTRSIQWQTMLKSNKFFIKGIMNVYEESIHDKY
jgi:hypothetical protein